MEIKKIALKLGAFTILVLALAGCTSKGAEYTAFAQCLTQKGVKMYGSFRCPHCLNQKELFGSSFQYVTYVECDKLSRAYDEAACTANKIESYPTWIFPNGTRHQGEMKFEDIAKESACELPTAAAPVAPVEAK